MGMGKSKKYSKIHLDISKIFVKYKKIENYGVSKIVFDSLFDLSNIVKNKLKEVWYGVA